MPFARSTLRPALLGTLIMGLVGAATTVHAGAPTPEELVSTLVQAIGDRDFVGYDGTLDDEFIFYFSPEDVDGLPGAVPFWDRAREMAAIQGIFSGQPGVNPSGDPIPPVASIEISAFLLQDWTDGSDAGPEFAGTLRSQWQFNVEIFYVDFGLISTASSVQELFAVQRGNEWWLFAWRELGPFLRASTEQGTWGGFKLGYAEIVVPVDEHAWSELKVRW